MHRQIIKFLLDFCNYSFVASDNLTLLIFIEIIVVFILLRFVASLLIVEVLKNKNIEHPRLWTSMFFFFGILALAVCFIINFRLGNSNKISRSNGFRFFTCVTCLVAVLFGVSVYTLNQADDVRRILLYKENLIDACKIPYFDDEKMEYYCYDQQSNKYYEDNYENFACYDRAGNKYVGSEDSDGWSSSILDDGEFYNCALDEQGYIVVLDNTYHYYYDEDNIDAIMYYKTGKMFKKYYPLTSVGWDESGKFVVDDYLSGVSQEKLKESYSKHPDDVYSITN